MEPIEIDTNLLIEELKAQRNQAFDALAIAGARIIALQKQVAELQKSG